MITDKEFLAAELAMGVSFDNPAFRALAAATAKQLAGLNVKTVLDYGAGTGVYADAYHQAGYEVKAFEIFPAHRDYMAEKVPHIEIIDQPITTDVLSFIETAEHMTDAELDKLFSTIYPEFILFSSTSQKTDFDESWGHINVKEQAEWDSYFSQKGYEKLKDLTAPTSWSKLYVKWL